MNVARNVFAMTALVAVLAGTAGSTFAADTNWEKHHPRREQVNNRLENQHDRIAKEVKEGEMTRAKAARLSAKDRQIRREERLMARQNGGHITKSEQAVLNQQENAVSRQIGK